jgi:hypothetical protein
LLAILFISGSLVSTACIYISTSNNVFLGTAIVVLTIVVITVFVIVVYEIYDSYLEKESNK